MKFLFRSYPTSNAVDGNIDNFYHSIGSNKHWIMIDLGSSVFVTKITVYERTPSQPDKALTYAKRQGRFKVRIIQLIMTTFDENFLLTGVFEYYIQCSRCFYFVWGLSQNSGQPWYPSPRNNPTSYKVQTIRCGRFLIFQKMFQEVFEANEIQVEAYQDN